MRLAIKDELPAELDATDLAEATHGYLFMTELTWPSLFFGTWAAFEPDVYSIQKYQLFSTSSITPGKRVLSPPCSEESMLFVDTLLEKKDASHANCARLHAQLSQSSLRLNLDLTVQEELLSMIST